MQAETVSIDVDLLEKLNRAYVDAVQNADARWFEEHLAEDFLNSNPDGSLVGRDGFLAQVARPAPIKGLRPAEVKIRLLGDVAVIHARTTYTKSGGQPASGRYTDIWQRRDNRWLCIAAHVTRG